MNLQEYASYDGLGLAELVKNKQVTPKELVQLAIQGIEKVNPTINAVVSVLEEQADNAITNLDETQPFAGVPFLIKELVLHAEGVPHSMGSRIAENTVVPVDSELMKRFKKAGLVLSGTTTTPEFGYNAATEAVVYGPTRNPWDPNFSPGGSSGGSAAAVASGIVPIAHANDGGGSIRIPASCSGLVGLKPTRGRIPEGPFNSELLNGIAIEFAVTKSIRDTAALLDQVAGPDIGSYSKLEMNHAPYGNLIQTQVRPLKIAWTTEPNSDVHVDPECVEAVHKTVQLLKELGHEVVEARPKYEQAAFAKATVNIWTANIYMMIQGAAASSGLKPSPEYIESAIWKCYEYGRELKASELLEATAVNAGVSRQVATFFEDYDVLLSPTIATLPAKIGELNANNPSIDAVEWTEQIFTYAPFTNLFNATGQPSLSLPIAMSKTGLPIGLQFTGKFADELTLLQLGKQLEEAVPWKDRIPTIHVSKPINQNVTTV
ncbi:amidase [Lysinibacillus sp. KU-BSD001]|uniref:amidase n=1 Tax=Lysinibacillus sp. KU-BSD001 TaxID=3141328 RepID=UPI0036E21F08